MVMEPIQGKLASSQFDFGYTEQFCIPGVTSVFFSSCDSVVGDSLEFNQQIEAPYVFDWKNAISLNTMKGNQASSRGERKVSWVFSTCGSNLGYILELRRGCPFETGVSSVKSGHLSRYEGHHGKLNYTWQENTDASGGEPGGQASLISCHSYIGIPINFHEESGIVTFFKH